MASFTDVLTAAIAGGGTVGAIVVGLLKAFGDRWLNSKFEERLAEYKHAQQKELEQLRFNISALMDRTLKLHQREFDVLPEVWSRLNELNGAVFSLVSPYQNYPDLNRYSDPELDELLSKSKLHEWERERLKQESDKTKFYIQQIKGHRFSAARNEVGEHHNFLIKNGIFVPADLRKKFYEIEQMAWDALTEYEINEQMQGAPRLHDKLDQLRKVPDLIKSLEEDVQSRLWTRQGLAQ